MARIFAWSVNGPAMPQMFSTEMVPAAPAAMAKMRDSLCSPAPSPALMRLAEVTASVKSPQFTSLELSGLLMLSVGLPSVTTTTRSGLGSNGAANCRPASQFVPPPRLSYTFPITVSSVPGPPAMFW